MALKKPTGRTDRTLPPRFTKLGWTLQEWTAEDWMDFHQTLEKFRKRLNSRHAEIKVPEFGDSVEGDF
jgi:hypothetical protein